MFPALCRRVACQYNISAVDRREDALSKASEVQDSPPPAEAAPVPAEAPSFSVRATYIALPHTRCIQQGFGNLEDVYKQKMQKQAPPPAAQEEAPKPFGNPFSNTGGAKEPAPPAPEAAAPKAAKEAPAAPIVKEALPKAAEPAKEVCHLLHLIGCGVQLRVFRLVRLGGRSSTTRHCSKKQRQWCQHQWYQHQRLLLPSQLQGCHHLHHVQRQKKQQSPLSRSLPKPRRLPSLSRALWWWFRTRASYTAPHSAVKEAPKKRKGPLPLWFAEVLLIGLYAAIVLAATKYYDASKAVLGGAASFVTSVYGKVEGFWPKKS